MEKILIRAIKSGNNDVLLKIYKQYRNDFIKWAISNYQVSIEQAKVVYKEVIIGFHENINAGKITELDYDLRTYLFQRARFKLIRIHKNDKNKASYQNVEDHSGFHLNSYLNQLSGTCKMMIKLVYINRLSMKEVAETMGYNDAAAAKKKRYECFQQLMELINMKQQHEKY
jgi:DNA-directed RNA polymerase specialized sigma24 family protein